MVIAASLALATALAVSPQPAEQAVAPMRQAQATVTILPAATIRFSELEQTDPERFRDTNVRDSDGSQPARLVEFE